MVSLNKVSTKTNERERDIDTDASERMSFCWFIPSTREIFSNFLTNPSTKDTRVNTLIKHVRTDRFAVERPRRQHETTHLQRFVFLGFDEEALPAS